VSVGDVPGQVGLWRWRSLVEGALRVLLCRDTGPMLGLALKRGFDLGHRDRSFRRSLCVALGYLSCAIGSLFGKRWIVGEETADFCHLQRLR
jgi:hypothetical protein